LIDFLLPIFNLEISKLVIFRFLSKKHEGLESYESRFYYQHHWKGNDDRSHIVNATDFDRDIFEFDNQFNASFHANSDTNAKLYD
jgi:hypothetical protein